MGNSILVVGDPHATPGYDNDRFLWLGGYIAERQPQTILVMGDWGDIPSLFRLTKPKDKEGLRLTEDLEVLWDSLEKLEAPITDLNRRLRAARRHGYRPRKVYVMGNHEARIEAYETEHPELEGSLSEKLTRPFLKRGWEIIPYKESVEIHGFQASHHFPSGVMGRPCSGRTGTLLAHRLTSRHVSSIVGHDHRFGFASDPVGKRRVWGINAGCYAHPEYRESWAKEVEHMWDRGVILLDGCSDGEFQTLVWVDQEQLRERYGR